MFNIKFWLVLLLIITLIILIINCFYKDNFNDAFVNNTVIVNFFTKDLCEEWKNHIYTLKKYNLDKYVVVFPLDNDALDCVKSENIKYNTKFLNKINVGQSDFDTVKFKQLMYFKILAIKHFIDLNYNVFYLDTDTIIFGNIIEDIKTFPKNIDLYAQEDENSICAGCMLLIPTENSKNLLNQCDNYFKHNWNNIMGNSDQALINKLVRKIKIKYHLLPWKKYASGKQYFDKNKKYFKNNKPLFLHNNWIKGLKEKTDRFKNHGLWYI